MVAQSMPFVPPAPKTHRGFVPLWRLVTTTDALKIWPDFAFEIDFNRRRVLGIDTFLLNDPEDIRHVLTANAANWRRPILMNRIARPLGGEGLFLAEGAAWRRQRRLLAPAFTPGAINRLVPHFQAAGEHLTLGLEGAATANLSLAFQDVALEAVLRSLFSMPENEARVKLSAMGRSYIEGPGHANILDIIARNEGDFPFFTRGRRRFQQNWFAAIEAVVAARRAQHPSSESRDLLDMMLSLRDGETGEGLSDAEIRDQCATMLFAGSETTARMMFWACYLLTQDRNEQARVRAEILAFPPERAQTLDDLQNWPRLRNVLLEALRLYPPIANILREAIGEDEVHGEKIQPGGQVWISPWVVHRHKKFWDRPTAFMPDRFKGSAAPWIQMPGFIPFGAGPRICIGVNFALVEAQIVLAHLLSRVGLGLASGKPVMPSARVTTAPSYEPKFSLERL
jgi:cytochrome P450